MDEGHFARIGDPAEHALAEKRGAELDAVKSARENAIGPAFDAMGRAATEERGVEADDLFVDPGLRPLGRRLCAAAHDRLECAVAGDDEGAAANGPAQPARDVEPLERQDAAAHRIDPERSEE